MQSNSGPHGTNTPAEPARSGWKRRILLAREPEPIEAPVPLAAPEPPPAIVAAGCTLEGKLVTDRPVRVEGTFRGTIESHDAVIVAEEGTVEGEIRGRSILILGAVVGDVAGRREVVLGVTGRLHGAVETASFEVMRGAFFNGATRMHRPQDRRQATPPPLSTD